MDLLDIRKKAKKLKEAEKEAKQAPPKGGEAPEGAPAPEKAGPEKPSAKKPPAGKKKGRPKPKKATGRSKPSGEPWEPGEAERPRAEKEPAAGDEAGERTEAQGAAGPPAEAAAAPAAPAETPAERPPAEKPPGQVVPAEEAAAREGGVGGRDKGGDRGGGKGGDKGGGKGGDKGGGKGGGEGGERGPEEAGEEVVEYLAFMLSREEYAVKVEDVKEIIRPQQVTSVPRAPEYVEGIFSLRGVIIPVFDIKKRLGLDAAEKTRSTRIVVVSEDGQPHGLLVDKVTGVAGIRKGSVEPPPVVIGGVEAEYLEGVGRVDGKLLILFNTSKVLAFG